MAILNSIRKRGVFLIIIIALALFAFVLDGVINSKTGGGGEIQDTVGTINGKDLSREDFMSQVESQQRAMGPNANTATAMNAVWDRELRSTLIQQQVESLGMTVSQDQLNETLSTVLSNNPTFVDDDGNYSEAKMIEYVASIQGNDPQSANARNLWNNFIESTKEGILQTNYLNMVRGGLASTIAEGESQYRFENDKINVQYLHVPYTTIADEDVTVSEAEIEAYMRANPAAYEVEPMADIQYVTYLEEPSEEDMIASKGDVAKMIAGLKEATDVQGYVSSNSDAPYQDRWMYTKDIPAALTDTLASMNVGDVYGPYQTDFNYNISKLVATRQMPDSVKARHILIPIGLNRTDSITRTKEQAKVTADSLFAIIKRNKSKFAGFVKDFSSDAGSVDKGGSYDYYPYQQMVGPFRDFTFEGKKGDLGVVETQFGYHIIEIEGQKNMTTVYKVATVTKETEPSEQTLSDVFSRGAKFEETARAGDFTAVAQESGLTPKPVNNIGELDATIPGIGNNRSIVNWAFEEDAKVGDVKRFNINDTYVIAQLTRKSTKKALMSIAEASATVTPILRKEKKAAKIRATISGTDMQDIASGANVVLKSATALTRSNPTIAGAGTEPAVVGAAFGKAAGETTQLIDGETGVFMVKVLAHNPAPQLENYQTYANQLNAAATSALNNNVFNALKNAADIEDNRASFY